MLVNNLYYHAMNKYFTILILALTAALFMSVSAARGDSAGTESVNPVSMVRDSVLSYFHASSGKVVDVTTETVTIEQDARSEIRKGSRLSVYRTGAPFYHPSTGEMIGYTEDFTGRIEVTGTGEAAGQYVGTVIQGDIRTGDIVRVTSSRINLAFFQERETTWRLAELLYRSLKESRRFRILETYTESYSPEDLSGHARRMGAEVVLLLSTPVIDDTRMLNVRLMWAEDARVFAEIQERAESGVADVLLAEEALIDISRTGREPWESYDIRGGELIGVGDVTGNGVRNLVASDGTELAIYNMENALQEIWSLKESSHVRHLSIDVHDMNNNGRAEIFVTALANKGRKMISFVLEYDPVAGYRKIVDGIPFFLRVMNETLLMQKFTTFGLFTGPVYEGVWKDGSYTTGDLLKLPYGVNIYGFTYIDWKGDGDIHLVTFDDEGYLNMYKNGASLWRSGDSYGEFDIRLRKKIRSVMDNTDDWEDDSPDVSPAGAYVRARLFAVKTSRGQELIVVKRIPLLSNVPGLGNAKAEIRSLWWDGDIMEEEIMMKGISGPVTDYQIDGSDMYLISRTGIAGFIKEALSGDLRRGSKLYSYTFSRDED
jgi:hypothetical protein